jgi:hypothetical protein
MPISFDNPTPEQVQAAIRAGESQMIEFKVGPTSGLTIAQNISAFANCDGGAILVGVRENPNSAVGCSYQAVSQVYDKAIQRLWPVPESRLHRVTIGSRDVGVIVVKPHLQIVFSDAGAFIRRGGKTETMTVAETASRLPAVVQQPDRDLIAEAFSRQTAMIVSVQEQLRYSQSLRGQLTVLLLSFFLGCITGVIGNYIFKALGN